MKALISENSTMYMRRIAKELRAQWQTGFYYDGKLWTGAKVIEDERNKKVLQIVRCTGRGNMMFYRFYDLIGIKFYDTYDREICASREPRRR